MPLLTIRSLLPSPASRRLALFAGGTLMLVACGNKGQLTLPPKDLAPQKTAAAAPAPANAAPANPAPDNSSTSTPPPAAK